MKKMRKQKGHLALDYEKLWKIPSLKTKEEKVKCKKSTFVVGK